MRAASSASLRCVSASARSPNATSASPRWPSAIARMVALAGGKRVMDGVHRRAVLEMPLRRPPVQLGDPASRRVPELRAQQLREEMVVAIPGRLRVEPLDEDVVGDEALREVSAVRAFG